ncbi:MAG: hypothetical protein ACRCV6_00120 [Formosimonas sp.]
MDWILIVKAFILGVVEGLTEFLPIYWFALHVIVGGYNVGLIFWSNSWIGF